MDAYLPLQRLTERDLDELTSQFSVFEKCLPDNFRWDVTGSATIKFSPSALSDFQWHFKPTGDEAHLENLRVEVNSKRNGGNLRVRICVSVDASYLALVTVRTSDSTDHHLRLIRCHCCVEESDDWIHMSRQKSTLVVDSLPFSIEEIKTELLRQQTVLREMAEERFRAAPACPKDEKATINGSSKGRRRQERDPRRMRSSADSVEPGEWTAAKKYAKIFVYGLVLVQSFRYNDLNTVDDEYVTMISGQYVRYLDLFFDAFENLERNESYAKSWLLGARHLKNHRLNYIDQLKALTQDVSTILDRLMSVRLPPGRVDEIRALLYRLGLLDSNYAYRALHYKKEDSLSQYLDIAEFGYLFWGHVEEFIMQLPMRPIVGYHWVDDVLLPDAMAIRYWIGQRWTRVGVKRSPPILERYREEPRNEDGTFKHLPDEYVLV